jgi:F0F1-type ATP synthase assembly protein I
VRQPLSSKLIPSSRPDMRPGSAVSNGAEIAGGLLVFFLIGFGLDIWLDTRPVFMIAMSLFAAAGIGARTYYAYTDKMKKLEDDRRNHAKAPARENHGNVSEAEGAQ